MVMRSGEERFMHPDEVRGEFRPLRYFMQSASMAGLFLKFQDAFPAELYLFYFRVKNLQRRGHVRL